MLLILLAYLGGVLTILRYCMNGVAMTFKPTAA